MCGCICAQYRVVKYSYAPCQCTLSHLCIGYNSRYSTNTVPVFVKYYLRSKRRNLHLFSIDVIFWNQFCCNMHIQQGNFLISTECYPQIIVPPTLHESSFFATVRNYHRQRGCTDLITASAIELLCLRLGEHWGRGGWKIVVDSGPKCLLLE